MPAREEQPSRRRALWLSALLLTGAPVFWFGTRGPDTIPPVPQGSLRAPSEEDSKEAKPVLQLDFDDVKALPASRLRELLIETKHQAGDKPEWFYLSGPRSLAQMLGRREGNAGADWLEREISTDLLPAYISGWTEVDPAAALDYITHATRPMPCGIDDVSKMLAHAGQVGPEKLASAVREIPWHLFEPFDQQPELFFREGLGTMISIEPPFSPDETAIDPDATEEERENLRKSTLRPIYQVWIDSGAARYLEEHGVPIFGFFGQYAKLDQERAFSEWAAWNLPENLSAEGLAGCLIGSEIGDSETSAKLRQLYADPATSARTLQMISWYSRRNQIDAFERLVPELAALVKPSETPAETEEASPTEEK